MQKTEAQKKILYISYDGILEPLGYSQVLKYMESLSKDFEITLISFEKIDLKIGASDFLQMQQHCLQKKLTGSQENITKDSLSFPI